MPLKVTGAAPFSNAGVKSTSLGIIPLFKRVIMPFFISSSVIGGGSSTNSGKGGKYFLTVLPCLAA